ncbi:MAG: VWA domain-containing protein [Chthoniobacter sp.]|nr:VWA domain-containing protein [Chthoniobacter sp.]
MNFLNAALLPGLVLLAGLPLVIHLLNLRFPRLFEFSSVKRIRETIAQRSRIFRWRHLLLLLLRTAFLALLLLAFLKPLLQRFDSKPGQQAPRAVLIVVDHSLSMEHKGGGLSSRERAENEADKILTTLGAEDSVNIITVGQVPQACFFELSRNHAEAKHFLASIKPGYTRADFSQANAVVARLLAQSGSRPEIYYLSDFQRRNWANVDFTALPPAARLFFVDCAPPHPDNRAILGATLSQSQVLAGDTVTLEVELGNFRDQAMQEPLKIVLDGRTSFEKEVTVAPWSTAKVTLPVPAGAPGLHQCEISIAPDDLALDDHYFLTIPVMEKEGILIVSDSPDPQRDAVLFLKTALNPYEDQSGSLLPEHIPAAELTSAKLATVRKVFFTRAGKLSDATCKLVADFIFHGGGVTYFLDGENDPANLAGLERAMGANTLPLKLGSRRVAKNVGTQAQQIIRGDFKSRYLRLFRGANRQNLALLEFYDIYDAAATGAGNVLLTYADDTPAMASLNHGLGTMLFLNFSVSEFSSNLARQRIFPAWMQEIVKNLTSDEPLPVSTQVGEPVTDEIWKSELAANPLRKPTGEPLEVRAEAVGERVGIAFTPDELGFYSMRGTKLLHSYAVNPPPDESDLRPIDRALLPEQLSEKGQTGFFVSGHEDFENLILGQPIFHWFVLAAVALLLIELLFQLFLQRAATKQP